MPLIKLSDVSKIYGFGDATTVALEDVSLELEKGEFVAVMGPSGSGKSTLMNVIGLLDHPTHGRYELDSRSVERLRPNARAKVRRDKIGFVFQSPSLLSGINSLDNVSLPLAYRGRTLGKRSKMAHDMLDRVGLADRAYYYPGQLSGGQMQRVAIARALINSPDILIADEPTGNLDSGSSQLVIELLREVHQMGNTVLLVTHNPELTRYANRVIYMFDGSIVKDEQTKIGDVSPTAIKSAQYKPLSAEDADLEAVSALVDGMPIDNEEVPFRKVEKVNKKSQKKHRLKKKSKRSKRS